MRRYVQGLVVLSLCVAAFAVGCRRNQPSLIDRNQPPDTQLWFAPPDSTEYEYLVHMYWRGVDNDGTATRFIWTVRDTLATDAFRWSPAERLNDYREGRITSRTDSLFSFTAYKDVAGVGVRKSRQAFYVASIDDNGVIDPTPAAVEFVATIDRLPEMRFVTYIDGVAHPYSSDRTPPADTVGMFKPFQISYHGITRNGNIQAYEFFPLSSTIVLPGANIWSEDLTDTLRSFPNTGVDALPAGSFRFAARCLDEANAQSQVDAGQFRRGVCQVVVNFDPDTRITEVFNTYFRNNQEFTTPINFTDGVPDTVPFRSWVNYRYNAWDDNRDVRLCSPTDPDKCIDFQVKYVRDSNRVPGAREDSGWLPRNGRHDSDANSATDSNTVNIGSLEYEWYARGIDENGTPDGTPPLFKIVGNYDPILDSMAMRDHFNQPLNLATVDTLTWNFYKGIGWPYNAETDTFDTGTGKYTKKFGWSINATGHDDPRDPIGSAVQSWRYYVYTNYNAGTNTGTFWALGRAGNSWFPGPSVNFMTDTFQLTVRYNDPDGDDLFANQPGYFNNLVTIVMYGRDTRSISGDFEQNVYLNEVPSGAVAGSGPSKKNLINAFPTGELGRWTPRKVVQFYLKFER
ncbi:MAG TPA: hypothetical protein VFX92_06115 [Candidatus Krumholzibacteria bacterium]|nr:hypothetical protein [Candidatus Krumholzibacteria bacterium]